MECEENWDEELEQNNQQTTKKPTAEVVEVIPGYSTFDQYLQSTFNILKAGIKAGNNLPSGENFNYYTCFPSFNDARKQSNTRLLESMQMVVEAAGISRKMKKLEPEDRLELVIETNDLYLDRAGECMDKECGIVKNPEIELVVLQSKKPCISGSWNANATSQTKNVTNNQPAVRLLAGKNIHRPQLMFKDKIDNSCKPWVPRIKEKPNALKPLFIYMDEDDVTFNHPYEFELDKFEPPENLLKMISPKMYKPLEDTPLIIVDKPEDLNILIQDLKNYTEIAVDLEHHSYRSFQGITCLLQISTANTDYLVDTLTLRSELHELNEIFTKPTVLKVFHGAESDIQWLQRDLSLYVVNMFDTHQAAKQLNLPYLSLAYLLKKHCGVDPNKHFQLADWRIRPLPEELMLYAREDTHYLLYIKDILVNALLEAGNGRDNILKSVYSRSTEICKQVYMKPIWTEDSFMNMYRKSQKMFNNKQLYALKELHKWRDQTARQEDDSVNYVLPNHMLLNITETLPREMQGILACCNPIPPLVRQNLLKIHKMILKARDQPLIKPILEDPRQRLTQRTHDDNPEIWMYSAHDIPGGTEARADLPCLLDNNFENVYSHLQIEHKVTVFDSPPSSEHEDSDCNTTPNKKKNKLIFVSPYERYKRVRPMIAEEEARERERQEKEEQKRIEQVEQNKEDSETCKPKSQKYSKDPLRNPKATLAPTLYEMHGRKRKQESNINDKTKPHDNDDNVEDLSTPMPCRNVIPKLNNTKFNVNRSKEFNNEAKKGNKHPQSIRVNRKKGEKKVLRKELEKQGLLPSTTFDYKAVDFGSFQGGSLRYDTQVKLEEKKPKNKQKWKRKKKQQLGI